MIRPSVLALAGAAMLVSAVPAAAQQQPDLAPGTRVRVSTPQFGPTGMHVQGSSSWTVGEVIRIDADDLTLDTGGRGTAEYTVPLSTIRRLEVSQGTIDSHAAGLRGARRGALMGAITGAAAAIFLEVLPLSDFDDDDSSSVLRPGWTKPYVLVAGGTALGTGIGYTAGSSAKEQWAPHPAWRVSVGTDGGRHTVGLRVR